MNDNSPKIAIRGWLDIHEPKITGYTRVFCTVARNLFILASDEKNTTIFESIHLSHVINAVFLMHANMPSFKIICSSQKTFLLSTESKNDARRWIMALLADPEPLGNITMEDFDVIKVLGRGGTGKVVLARKLDNGKLYAIKSIQKRCLVQDKKALCVISERNVLMRTNHPFITKLYFAFQTPKKFYLALEYVECGDLSKWILQENFIFSDLQVRLIIAEIAMAIIHLHKIGVVFRDLKPQNVLLCADGHIKLTDFGLAKDILNDHGYKTLCGTQEYIAPEMIKGSSYSFGVDWWALGIITYIFYMGCLPFQSDNRKTLFSSIVNQSVELPNCIDPVIKDFILSLLEKDPSKRIGSKDGQNEDVLMHPFFNGIDMEAVFNKTIDIGYCPLDVRSQNDILNEVANPITGETDGCASYIVPNFSFCFDEIPPLAVFAPER